MIINKINEEYLENLKQVIEAEEGHKVTIDHILSRVLEFYKQFVPYN